MAGHYEDEDQPLMTDPDVQREANVDVDTKVGSDSHQDASQHRPGDSSTAAAIATDGGHPDAPLDASDGTLQVEDENDPPTPRFLQEENAWKRWKWVPYPVRRTIRAIGKWSRGPVNPQPYRIKPFFPMVLAPVFIFFYMAHYIRAGQETRHHCNPDCWMGSAAGHRMRRDILGFWQFMQC
jgi:hypothetical protein